jgi:hypothetical protein
MSSSILGRYVNPWKFKRDRAAAERVAALRQRDGEDCRRCRRPLRFDLPEGHDLGPRLEPFAQGIESLDNFCLTHRRCTAEAAADATREVSERVRRHNEAELFAKARKRA